MSFCAWHRPVCPWCLKTDASWTAQRTSAFQHEGDTTTYPCPHCAKSVTVTLHIAYSFSTEKATG